MTNFWKLYNRMEKKATRLLYNYPKDYGETTDEK